MVRVNVSWTTVWPNLECHWNPCLRCIAHPSHFHPFEETQVVGSVTVHPRATHATEKCTVRRSTESWISSLNWTINCTLLAGALFHPLCVNCQEASRIHPFQHPWSYSLVQDRTICRKGTIRGVPRKPRGHCLTHICHYQNFHNPTHTTTTHRTSISDWPCSRRVSTCWHLCNIVEKDEVSA